MQPFKKLSAFFFPGQEAKLWRKFAPYGVLVVLFSIVLVGGAYTWEYTNSPTFCGEGCHTMPPEYSTYLQSPHAEIKCVECHIGREFIGNQMMHKVSDIRHVTAMLFSNYEYPIRVKSLRPAQEICERCHSDEKFSFSTLKEIVHYGDDPNNTPYTILMSLKTGGGTFEEGLGSGIHWHSRNQVFFYSEDPLQQDIPYVLVKNQQIGTSNEFIALGSDFDPYSVDESDLIEMDCISCHNRISHSIPQPDKAVDTAITQGLISASIPEIKSKAVEVLLEPYSGADQARLAIGQLDGYYRDNHAGFYDENSVLVYEAIEAIKDIYSTYIFPEQQVDWNTHPDNIGHQDSPGCFRCHDGQHLDIAGRGIPMDCNLCHSLPVVYAADSEIITLTIDNTQKPTTHGKNNWLFLHGVMYDPEIDEEYEVCSQCHTTADYDTADNTSFCSNSACHGGDIAYLNFEVYEQPDIFRNLVQMLPHYPNTLDPVAEWVTRADPDSEEAFFEKFTMMDQIHAEITEFENDPDKTEILCEDCHDPMPPSRPASREKCIACHGETEQGWMDLTAKYESNPHDGHYGDIPCSTCHQTFGDYVNPCVICHEDIPYNLIEEEN